MLEFKRKDLLFTTRPKYIYMSTFIVDYFLCREMGIAMKNEEWEMNSEK